MNFAYNLVSFLYSWNDNEPEVFNNKEILKIGNVLSIY